MSIIRFMLGKRSLEKGKKELKESVAAFKKEISRLDNASDSIIQASTAENILIIKTQSYSIGTMAKVTLGNYSTVDLNNKCQYKITTKDGTEAFVSNTEETLFTTRDILTIYDTRTGKRKIGTIKQWLVSGGVPLFEKDAKTCTVTLQNEKLCDLKKCVFFGDLQIETSASFLKVRIESDNEYSIHYKGQKIAKLHEIPAKLKDGFVDRYVLEYNDKKHTHIVVMLAIALDIVNN